VINLVLSPISLRLDLSQGQAYTLSQSTKEVLNNVDDVVTIRFFVSSDLPSQIQPLRTDVRDLLSEYDRASDRVRVSVIDPTRDEEAQTQANEAGIQELQFSQLDRDEFAVKTGYFGIAVRYGDETEAVPQVTEIGDLEYNLTSAIYKMTRDEEIKLAILGREDIGLPPDLGMQGMMNQQSSDQLSILKQELRKQYTIENLNVSTSSAVTSIDESFRTILVFDDNQKQYDEQEQQAIQDYIGSGGKALFFIDGVWVNEQQGLITSEATSNLNELVQQYGITVENNLILSEAAELVSMGSSQQGMQLIRPYPFWMKTNNFADDVPYFSNVNQLIYPWTSSLTLEEEGSYTQTVLVQTTGRSWEQRDDFVLFPDTIPEPKPDDFQDFTLAARAESEDNGSVVVFPTSRFPLDQFVQRSPGNLNAILNIVSDFASDGALAGIRQRAVSFYPLPELPQLQQDIFKYTNILLLPALFGIFGAVRLMKRK
jgi:ABC-type uncharacterized transport system involved in gliding motility auxiliary subunit